MLVGYGLTLTGVGAPIGTPMMLIGNGMSAVSSTMNLASSWRRNDSYGIVMNATAIGLSWGGGRLIGGAKNLGTVDRALLDTGLNLKINLFFGSYLNSK